MQGRSMDLALNRITGRIEDKCFRCRADIAHALNRNRLLNKSFTIKRLADNIDKDCQHKNNEAVSVVLIDSLSVTEGTVVNIYNNALIDNGGLIIFVNTINGEITGMIVYAGTDGHSKWRSLASDTFTEYPLKEEEVVALLENLQPGSMDYNDTGSAQTAPQFDCVMYTFAFKERVEDPIAQ